MDCTAPPYKVEVFTVTEDGISGPCEKFHKSPKALSMPIRPVPAWCLYPQVPELV
jgi:hypothetical protein